MKKILAIVLPLVMVAALAMAQSVDYYSPIFQLLLMGTGNDAATWGTNTNANLVALENALAGVSSISVTGGSLTLSQAQFGSGAIVFSGTLASNEVITLPAEPRYLIVANYTTGAYTLTLQVGAGTPITVPQSASVVHFYWSDGTNILDVSSDGLPVITSNTVFANIGAGPAAVPFASLATAMGLGTGSTPIFASLALQGAAGTARAVFYQTGTLNRWIMGANTTAESGANAGSDFVLSAYDDTGLSLLGNWIQVTRATGAVSMPGALAVTGQITEGGQQINPLMDGVFRNLKITVTANTTISVSADAFIGYDGTNAKAFRGLGVASASTASSGAINQMDTGGPGTNRWLQVWAVGNPSNGVSGVVLTQTAAPSPPSPLPSGYTMYARAGAVKVDGSGNLYGSIQRGNVFQWVVNGGNVTGLPPIIADTVTSGDPTVPTYTQFVVAATSGASPLAIVPPTAQQIGVMCQSFSSSANACVVAPNGSYGNISSTTNPAPIMITGAVVQAPRYLVLESTSIYGAAQHNVGIFSFGYVDSVSAN